VSGNIVDVEISKRRSLRITYYTDWSVLIDLPIASVVQRESQTLLLQFVVHLCNKSHDIVRGCCHLLYVFDFQCPCCTQGSPSSV